MTVLKKVRLRLTLLCTGVTALILFLISLAYLLVAESNLKNNQFQSFQDDIKTILGNLESQQVITHDWLAKLEAGNRYLVFLRDNGVSLLYESLNETEDRELLYQTVTAFYEEHKTEEVSSRYASYHTEFTFPDTVPFLSMGKDRYYVSYCYIPKNQGQLEAYILRSLTPVYDQIYRQRFLFCLIDVLAVSLLYCFFRYFVKLMLRPVAESQEKQNLFIAAASHEFRTPLAVIMSCVSAMKEDESRTFDVRPDFYGILENETDRMSRLIDDMLFLTNRQNPNQQLQLKDYELETLLLKCYEAFERMALEKKVAIHIRLPEDPMPPCHCDPERISQLLAILAHNAVSYTDAGGEITFSAWYGNGCHSIVVADTGIGIRDADKKKIFNPFYRVDIARNRKGHFGLGLGIASEIVKAHNGSISVEDTPGRGSTFVVRLPHRGKVLG